LVSIVGGLGGAGTGGGGAVNILGGSPPTSGTGGNVAVTAGDGAGIAAGGAVTISGGDSADSGVGGTISLAAGEGGSEGGVGGAILIDAGDSSEGSGDIGGPITITTGTGDGTSNGGDFIILTGSGGAGGGSAGGDFSLTTGSGISASGAINLTTSGSAGISGDITLEAGTGGTDGVILFTTGGASRFAIADDGTLEAKTASYETLVLADQDMTNKKYVDDSISGAPHPYDLTATMDAPVPIGFSILRFPVVRPFTLLSGPVHLAFCDGFTTATVGPATFAIVPASPGGTPFGPAVGTITFAIGATVGVVTVGAPVAFATGDELIILYVGPDVGGTLANVGITLFCTTP